MANIKHETLPSYLQYEMQWRLKEFMFAWSLLIVIKQRNQTDTHKITNIKDSYLFVPPDNCDSEGGRN